MNVLKNPSFFRPSSRPSSPAPPMLGPIRPESSQGTDRQSRPSTKLSLTSFIRQTPSQSPSPISNPAPLVQDGSYLEMLSLKLSEAVSKALAQPTGPLAVGEQPSAKRPIPQGRGLALGSLIASYETLLFLLSCLFSQNFLTGNLTLPTTTPIYIELSSGLCKGLSRFYSRIFRHNFHQPCPLLLSKPSRLRATHVCSPMASNHTPSRSQDSVRNFFKCSRNWVLEPILTSVAMG